MPPCAPLQLQEDERGAPRLQVGYWLQTTRAIPGWTKKEVADYLGVTYQAIDRWEKDKSSMPAELLIILVRLRKQIQRHNNLSRGPVKLEDLPSNWRRQKNTIMSL